MDGLSLIASAAGLLAGAGALERWHHRRHLLKIPIRVHVNGTRGKSSVTRLIAAGLRAGGVRTCAKTTGTLARMILPSADEYPVYRPARPNVLEQIRIVRTAAELQAEALVIECMAVQPILQALSEEKMVVSTHGVITNARADHLDAMGPTEIDVARALAGTAPRHGILFTAETRHRDILEAAAVDRHSRFISVGPEDFEQVTNEDLEPFSYLEHAENVALALTVCEELGVPRDRALTGMQAARPDPGALIAFEVDFFGRRLVFVNAFAANDPESTERIWNRTIERFPDLERRIAVVNCRGDRPERSRQLGNAVVDWPAADRYVLIGSGTYLFARAAFARGLDPTAIIYAEEKPVEDVFELLVEHAGGSALILGIANIGGPGLDLVRFFRNRAAPGAPRKVA